VPGQFINVIFFQIITYFRELVVRRYTGSLNFHHLIRGTISPCGRLIFNGSEDGVVHVWNSETGKSPNLMLNFN